jgi:circadian clock protein KaiC
MRTLIPPLLNVCSTGVPGLDEVLNGGLPSKRLYLIKGDPGVGKTTLAMQFLLEGAQRGELGLYVHFQRPRRRSRSSQNLMIGI